MQPRRVSSLDGLRGIAIGLVVLFHYGYGFEKYPVVGSIAAKGWIGVDLFFVMSGFLIGGIVLANKETDNIFWVFYARRFLRIFPLYYLLLTTVVIFTWAGWMAPSSRGLTVYFLYLQNIVGGLNDPGPFWLQATWSLAVEEHFYLLLPLIVVLVPKRSFIAVIFSGIIFAFFLKVFAYLLFDHPEQYVLFFTPCRGDGLLYGVSLAWFVRYGGMAIPIQRRIAYCYVAAAFFLLVFVLTAGDTKTPLFAVGLSALGPLFFFVVALVIMHENGPIGLLTKVAALRWIGIRTYAIYLAHLPALASTKWFLGIMGLNYRGMTQLWALVLTLGFAAITWPMLERPLIKFGHRLKYAGDGQPPILTLAQ